MQGDCGISNSVVVNLMLQVIWDDKSGLYPALGQTYHCGLQGRFDLTILDLGPTGIAHPATRSFTTTIFLLLCLPPSQVFRMLLLPHLWHSVELSQVSWT